MIKYNTYIKLFVLNYVGMKCSCAVCVVLLAKWDGGVLPVLYLLCQII